MLNIFTRREDKKKIEKLTEDNATFRSLIQSKDLEIKKLQKQLATMKPLTEMDVIRKSLGIIPMVDFTNLAADDLPKNFLPEDTESQEYKLKIGELANIYTNQTFKELIAYLVNYQGNFSLRHNANSELKKGNGMHIVTGVEMVYSMIVGAYEKYREGVDADNQPFDPHEIKIDVSASAKSIADELLDQQE